MAGAHNHPRGVAGAHIHPRGLLPRHLEESTGGGGAPRRASVSASDVPALEICANARAPGVRHCALHRSCFVCCINGDMSGRALCMLKPPDKRTTARACAAHCRVLHRSCFARCVCGDMCGRALCMFIISSRHTHNCVYACCVCVRLASFMLCARHLRRYALDRLEARACA